MAADAQADAELVQKKAKEKIEAALADLGSVKQYLQKMIAENLKIPEWLQKQVTLLFTFIQTAIDFVLSGFKAAIDALKSPTKKLIELVIKLTTNPPKFFLDLLKKAIEPILISLAPKFTKVKGKISELKADVSRFLNEVFSLKSINLNKYKSAIFKAVAPFFALIACSLTFAITFLPVVIKSLIKF
jgi:regulator of replication initiation timing